jgi:hypothetical protein
MGFMMSPQIEQAMSIAFIAIIVVLVLIVIDRVLLTAEARGWINYRRNGLSRPGALYHTFELHSVFDPGIKQVIEISYEESKAQDFAGDPAGSEDGHSEPGSDSSRRGERPAGTKS